ncbi:FeoA family protein [Anaerolineales bacterium HSG25]|nr:FeoA family protein [Anaerolineales bacterium HSG25]
MLTNQLMGLSMAEVGHSVTLKRINATHKLTHRLTDLGLTPGTPLNVLQNQGGSLIIGVRNARVALGRGIAHKIMVEPNPEVTTIEQGQTLQPSLSY